MPTPASLDRAAKALQDGRLIGLPTETVYGLAANGLNPRAVASIFAAKGRPANNPLILHVQDAQHAREWMADYLSPITFERLDRLSVLWPGPLTVVAPKHPNIPSIVTAGGSTVGLRVPDHPVALALLRLVTFPLAAPSANPSNYISPTTAIHVAEGLGEAIDCVLDGGPCQVGLESTIIDLGDAGSPPRILRSGGITPARVAELLAGTTVASNFPHHFTTSPTTSHQGSDAATSPGQFAKHYSPRTPIELVDPQSSSPRNKSPDQRVLRITLFPPTRTLTGYIDAWTLSPDSRIVDVAANLYAMLRRADQESYDFIEIDRCDDIGLGLAINDRLRRASHR